MITIFGAVIAFIIGVAIFLKADYLRIKASMAKKKQGLLIVNYSLRVLYIVLLLPTIPLGIWQLFVQIVPMPLWKHFLFTTSAVELTSYLFTAPVCCYIAVLLEKNNQIRQSTLLLMVPLLLILTNTRLLYHLYIAL